MAKLAIATAFLLVSLACKAWPLNDKLVPVTRDNPKSDLVGNSTQPSTAISDSSTEATRLLEIIWSCATTLVACTWMSMHPNVPAENDGFWRQVGRRLKMMFVNLLAPDLVLFWAINQRVDATTVFKKYQSKHPHTYHYTLNR